MERDSRDHTINGWIAVIYTEMDRSAVPILARALRDGIYPDPAEALKEAGKKCQELHGQGYSIEPVYGSTPNC